MAQCSKLLGLSGRFVTKRVAASWTIRSLTDQGSLVVAFFDGGGGRGCMGLAYD